MTTRSPMNSCVLRTRSRCGQLPTRRRVAGARVRACQLSGAINHLPCARSCLECELPPRGLPSPPCQSRARTQLSVSPSRPATAGLLASGCQPAGPWRCIAERVANSANAQRLRQMRACAASASWRRGGSSRLRHREGRRLARRSTTHLLEALSAPRPAGFKSAS